MNFSATRRSVLTSLAALPVLSLAGLSHAFATGHSSKLKKDCTNLKISLNAYSFNDPLMSGEMSLEDMLVYCSEVGFDAVDITAYYFPGYPHVPDSDFLYNIKRKAFLLGLDISGTGVRNDFTEPDPAKRRESVSLVKNWIEAAEKLGAPVIRVFAGKDTPEGHTREEVEKWMTEDIHECIDHGRKHGVVVAVQNHHDFLKTADEVDQLIKRVDSEWFGLILDTGSYRSGDAYQQIAQTIPHAVNWQVKEKIFMDGVEKDTDLVRLVKIIREGCYKGYLPIETLGAGDPRIKVKALFEKLRSALHS